MTREVYYIGNTVVCDWSCGADFTNSDRSGGLLFGSKACCPDCAPKCEADAKRYGEERFIAGRCPPGMSFRDWVLRLRDGDNTLTVITGESFEEVFGSEKRNP